MCGLAGFAGVTDATKRMALIRALGAGIDTRGGHAAGYVSMASHKGHKLAKRIGTWGDASQRFIHGAAAGHSVMMHTRFATCGGQADVEYAHPFTIKREGKTVLYGVHNGVLGGTYSSAAAHGREHTVDSREMLELLADENVSAVNKLTGYGVAMWVTPGSDMVYMSRLSDNSDIVVVRLKCGGVAWASTMTILAKALRSAKLKHAGELSTEGVGVVYAIGSGGVCKTGATGVRVEEDNWRNYGSYGKGFGKLLYGDDLDYTAADLARDNHQDALDRAERMANGPYWRSDGKIMGVPKAMPRLPPPTLRRPLSEITLDNMTAQEIDSLTDDEWDAICDSYHSTPKNSKMRVG